MTVLFSFCSAALALSLLRVACILPVIAVGRFRCPAPPDSSASLSACVVFPAYNEAAGIVASVGSMFRASPGVPVIVIDDGSTDRTADILRSAFPDERRLTVITVPHAGYAAALRTGLEHCSADILVIADADTHYPDRYVQRGIAAFREPGLHAARALMTVRNPLGFLAHCQEVDYDNVSADMRAFSLVGALPVVSGPAGFWRTGPLRAAGGFSDGVLSADFDATLAVLASEGRMRLLNDISVATTVPATLPALLRQRRRWLYGNYRVLAKRARLGFRSPKTFVLMLHVLLYRLVLPVVLPLADVAGLVSVAMFAFTHSPAAAAYIKLYAAWVVAEWLLIAAERACQGTLRTPVALSIPVLRFTMRVVQFPAAIEAVIRLVLRKPVTW